MKKILSITIAAAALLSIASCQKENLGTPNVEPEKTVRVITGEFSNDETKTTLGTNDKPQWSEGDVIRVLNGTSYQDITLTNSNIDSEDASKITFSTTLEGMLYAVYPASATTMTSCDGNITFAIPAVQDGTFGSANICVASGDGETSNSIYFSNATAVVEMKVASDVVYANLGAANNIAGGMTVAMENKGVISGTTTTSLSSKSIFVTGTPSGSKFYMAVAPGETGAVTITCNTSTKSGSTNRGSKTLAMNKIYAMDLSSMTIDIASDLTGTKGVQNGQEFVLIKGSDGKYLKWATQNLAVTESGRAKWNSTNYQIGDYFQWAASYEGYGITEEASKVPTNLVIYTSFTNTGSYGSFSFKDSKQFNKASAPYGGDSYTKYTYSDSKTTLEPSDDVANIVLGGTWRMPTGGSTSELSVMCAATYWAWDATDLGYYVFKPGEGTTGIAGGRGNIGTDDKTKALLFFPAAGTGYGTNLSSAGSYGYYWSSPLNSDNTVNAYYLSFFSSNVNPNGNTNRYFGFSVRPVSD